MRWTNPYQADRAGDAVPFQLVLDDYELALPLGLEGEAHDRLLGLLESGEGDSSERAEVARRITEAIAVSLGCDVEGPTEKQVKYAIAIAKTLAIHIPWNVLKHRSAMNMFLTKHAALYRQRKSDRKVES